MRVSYARFPTSNPRRGSSKSPRARARRRSSSGRRVEPDSAAFARESVSERLLSGAKVPVAIAPAGYARCRRRLERVICAFDASPESRLALDWAGEFTRLGDAELTVYSVHSPIAFGHVGPFSRESINQARRSELERHHREALMSRSARGHAVYRRSGAGARAGDEEDRPHGYGVSRLRPDSSDVARRRIAVRDPPRELPGGRLPARCGHQPARRCGRRCLTGTSTVACAAMRRLRRIPDRLPHPLLGRCIRLTIEA